MVLPVFCYGSLMCRCQIDLQAHTHSSFAYTLRSSGVLAHAAAAYGDRAARVTEIAEQQKLGRRLVRGHPQLEAEVWTLISV